MAVKQQPLFSEEKQWEMDEKQWEMNAEMLWEKWWEIDAVGDG